jgi:hypothetical protein
MVSVPAAAERTRSENRPGWPAPSSRAETTGTGPLPGCTVGGAVRTGADTGGDEGPVCRALGTGAELAVAPGGAAGPPARLVAPSAAFADGVAGVLGGGTVLLGPGAVPPDAGAVLLFAWTVGAAGAAAAPAPPEVAGVPTAAAPGRAGELVVTPAALARPTPRATAAARVVARFAA